MGHRIKKQLQATRTTADLGSHKSSLFSKHKQQKIHTAPKSVVMYTHAIAAYKPPPSPLPPRALESGPHNLLWRRRRYPCQTTFSPKGPLTRIICASDKQPELKKKKKSFYYRLTRCAVVTAFLCHAKLVAICSSHVQRLAGLLL